MSKKHWVFIKRGLITSAKHRETMGIRVWLYLYMLDRCDWETGIVYGWKDKDEAADMEMEWRTIQQQRRGLERDGYIICKQRQHAQDIFIQKWVNPREYSGKVYNDGNNEEGTQSSAPLKGNEGAHQGAHQGAHPVYRNMRTLYPYSVINTHSPQSGDGEGGGQPPSPRAAVEEAFARVTGIPMPPRDKGLKASAKRWWYPLDRMLAMCGDDVGRTVQLINQAVAHMRNEKLTISAPQSIENVFTSEFGKSSATAIQPVRKLVSARDV